MIYNLQMMLFGSMIFIIYMYGYIIGIILYDKFKYISRNIEIEIKGCQKKEKNVRSQFNLSYFCSRMVCWVQLCDLFWVFDIDYVI